ncbi:MAG: DinB family protein [Nocardioides sp.]
MEIDGGDLKRHLWRDLQSQRDVLLAKVDGLSERELRLPRTPTGTSLLGLVKHAANVEYGYFGPTFGRTLDEPALIPEEAFDADPQADWYATEQESAADVIALYRRVQSFADETIDEREINASGAVAWWAESRRHATLGRLMIHVTLDLARHAGHADILRETIDGATGLRRAGDNVPQDYDWSAYVAKLTAIADRF